jgi:hypothetical protein
MADLNYHACERREKMAQYDARGIFLCYTCDKCHETKMSRYRPEVLTNPNYYADEAIEEDEY